MNARAGEVARARRGFCYAVYHPGHHPAHVGVDHGNPLPVGEAGDGPRGVGADAGQAEQRLDIGGHHVTVFGRDDRRALV